MNIQKLDTSLDPSKDDERKLLALQAVETYNRRFGNLDTEKSYFSFFELLWYSQMPCVDIKGLTSEFKDELSLIKKCFWREKEISCEAIFQKRPTDRGMCCSFNMKSAEKVFKTSKYKEAISSGQLKDSKNGFDNFRRSERFEIGKELIPEVGIEKGLTLLVDAHSDRIASGSISDNFHGFPILVDDSDKFPYVGRGGKVARPGFQNNIEVKAIRLEALNEIKRHDPVHRKCYFNDEHGLELHQNYSQSNCIFECEMEFAAKCLTTCSNIDDVCNCQNYKEVNEIDLKTANACVPWYYPLKDKVVEKLCNPWNIVKFNEILKKQIPRGLCTKCLPDCSATRYETTISYAELQPCDSTSIGGTSLLCNLLDGAINPSPWISLAQAEYINLNYSVPWYLNTSSISSNNGEANKKFSNIRSRIKNENEEEIFATEVNKNPSYNAYEKDIGIINVYFAHRDALKYETKNRMSFSDFIYQIGGSLGFVMGVSMISIVEIFYWIFVRLIGKIVN